MRLKGKSLNFVVNFLLGLAWGYMLVGILIFIQYISLSTIYLSFISLFISIFPSIVAILLLEYFILAIERDRELKKQTKLLQQLVDKNIK